MKLKTDLPQKNEYGWKKREPQTRQRNNHSECLHDTSLRFILTSFLRMWDRFKSRLLSQFEIQMSAFAGKIFCLLFELWNSCLNEKSYFLGYLGLARRPPVGGCQSNLIESHKSKRLLRSARNDRAIQNLPFSFRHKIRMKDEPFFGHSLECPTQF